jgi:hypothetical protein
MRFWLLVVVLGIVPASGCSPKPASSGLFLVTEPEDPLAATARELPVGWARVELTHSQPAVGTSEEATYEWTIVARVAPPENELSPLYEEPGWMVARLTLQPQFEKRYDDFTSDPEHGTIPRPGCRHLNLLVRCQAVRYLPGQISGPRATSGETRPGSPLSLDRGGWLGPSVDGKHTEVPFLTDLLEVERTPLSGLVEPIFRGPQRLKLPHTLELLRCGGETTRLTLAR